MSLTSRIKRLIKSDVNGWVQETEASQAVLAQTLQGWVVELKQMDASITAKQAYWLKLKVDLQSSQDLLDPLEHDIGCAISEKREDTAKALIRKMILIRKRVEKLNEEQEACRQELSRLKKEYRARRDSYDEIKAHLESCKMSNSHNDIFEEAKRLIPTDKILEHQVELELLRRLKQRRTEESEASYAS